MTDQIKIGFYLKRIYNKFGDPHRTIGVIIHEGLLPFLAMVLTGQHSCNKWNLAYGRKGAG